MTTPPPILRKTGRPLSISWSAIEAMQDCPRKWWYSYMEGKRLDKESTRVGSLVHVAAETYLNGGEVDPASRWARILAPGLPYVPTPEDVKSEGWQVEAGWTPSDGLWCGPLPFVGRVDFYHVKQGVVGDWKTTSDGTFQYAKTPAALALFGQPLLYAKAIWGNDPPEALTFQHVNLLTRGEPRALNVVTSEPVPWERVEDKWEEAAQISARMAAIATGNETAETVTANTGACRNYGGCDHAAYCTMSHLNRNTAPAADETVTLKESTVTNTPAQVDALRSLRAKLGLTGVPAPADSPTAQMEEAPAAPLTPTGEAALGKAARAMATVLDKLGYVPVAVLQGAAKQHGVEEKDVADALGTVLKAGKYVVATAPAPNIELVEDEALPATPAITEGMAWADATKALEAELAMAHEQMQEQEAALLARMGAERNAAPPQPAVPDEPAVPAPVDDNDRYARVAFALIEALKVRGPLTKTAAGLVVKGVMPEVQRVRDRLWMEVQMASSGALVVTDTHVRLTNASPAAATTVADPSPATATAPPPEVADPNVSGTEPPPTEVPPAAAASPAPAPERLPSFGPRRCTVLIDALPIRQEYVEFGDWVRQYEEQVETEEGVPHYGVMGFGQGPQKVTAKVKAALYQQGVAALPRLLVMSSFHPLAPSIVPILQRVEGVAFIKGVR